MPKYAVTHTYRKGEWYCFDLIREHGAPVPIAIFSYQTEAQSNAARLDVERALARCTLVVMVPH